MSIGSDSLFYGVFTHNNGIINLTRLQHLPKWNLVFCHSLLHIYKKRLLFFMLPAFDRPGVSPKAAEILHRETRWIDQTMPISD